jgi:hypothetical protein
MYRIGADCELPVADESLWLSANVQHSFDNERVCKSLLRRENDMLASSSSVTISR